MKKLLTLLFSLFLLSSPSVFADDISDFSIEGMSIGDSLLDYMTEDEILEGIEKSERYYFLNEPNKFIEIYLNKTSPTYDNLSVFIKNNSSNKYVSNNNNKHIIQGIRGLIRYNEDFYSCMVERDQVVEVLPEMFPNAQKNEHKMIHAADPSEDSITDGIYFYLDSGAIIYAVCIDFEETFRIENNWDDTLNIVIQTKEMVDWMEDY